MVVEDDEVGALFFAGQFQINVVAARDAADGLVLEYLKAGAEAQHDAGAHGVAGLTEQPVGGFGRMGYGKTPEHGGQLLLCVAGQHLVDGREVSLLGRAAGVLIHIEDECLQEIGLTVIPEVVALTFARIRDNDIGQHLSQQCITAEIGHAVP